MNSPFILGTTTTNGNANGNGNANLNSSINGPHIRSQSTTTSDAQNTNSRPIYVAATQQHVGKTTTCLSLISGLKKRFPHSIGFMKPVGQQHVPVYSELMGSEIRVDKDVTLIREHFDLQHIDYHNMSPVLIPSGTCHRCTCTSLYLVLSYIRTGYKNRVKDGATCRDC